VEEIMPLITDGMSFEEAELIAKPAPKAKYLIEITGFIAGEGGELVSESEKGNKMLKVRTKIVKDAKENTEQAGKFLKVYNAVFGTGFMASFKRAFPDCLTETGAINTDLAIGLQAYADTKISSYEGVDSAEIAKLYPKNA
jgi:hypothetical protein